MVIFKLLLILHLTGDFFLQPIKLVEKKKNSIKALILQTIIYSSLITSVLLLFGNILEIILLSLFIFISHFAIDYFRIKITKKHENNNISFWIFIIDQFLHITLLAIISLIIKSDLNQVGNTIHNISFLQHLNFRKLIDYVLAVLIILKPASAFIKYFFNYLFNKRYACENNESDHVGSIIGMLERVVILLLGALGLYGSIALVLTAKSLARFKQLENQNFAEKYLVGTLISLIIATLSLFIIK